MNNILAALICSFWFVSIACAGDAPFKTPKPFEIVTEDVGACTGMRFPQGITSENAELSLGAMFAWSGSKLKKSGITHAFSEIEDFSLRITCPGHQRKDTTTYNLENAEHACSHPVNTAYGTLLECAYGEENGLVYFLTHKRLKHDSSLSSSLSLQNASQKINISVGGDNSKADALKIATAYLGKEPDLVSVAIDPQTDEPEAELSVETFKPYPTQKAVTDSCVAPATLIRDLPYIQGAKLRGWRYSINHKTEIKGLPESDFVDFIHLMINVTCKRKPERYPDQLLELVQGMKDSLCQHYSAPAMQVSLCESGKTQDHVHRMVINESGTETWYNFIASGPVTTVRLGARSKKENDAKATTVFKRIAASFVNPLE